MQPLSGNSNDMAGISDVVASVRSCIVQVAAAPEPDVAERVGTGFFAAPDGRVLTAAHVVAAAGDRSLLIGVAHQARPTVRGSFTYLPVDVVATDDDRDIALLQPARNPLSGQVQSGVVVDGAEVPLRCTVASPASGRPADGTAVAVSGFPVTEPVLVTTTGVVASAWAFDPTEVPDGPAVTAIRDYYLLDVTANPGNSGGPAYDAETGEVIGVCVSFRVAAGAAEAGDQPLTFPYNSGLTLVTPIGDALKLLG